MREDPDITREMFPEEEHDSIDLAIRTTLMMDGSALDYSTDRLEKGVHHVQWKLGEPLSKFIERIFTSESHTILSYPEHLSHPDFKSELKATRLKRGLGIAIHPTADLRDHLKLDRKTMTLKGVLFPLTDKKSRKLLRSYVESEAFDPAIQNFEFRSIKNKGEEVVPFFYLASRLDELHQELLDPSPRGWLERQFERRSGSRYMMMATMVGIFFAVFLGFLALVVSSYQTYIAYQAWQHPISPAGG
ncbi:hypothetical protein CSUB01_01449 [Colletotrichum sublineola]|uniref:Uncharacterized protein n=1 Tax=Colletotrichum sublineola TaxID=1173701 RepID=A0A066X1S3_COLSU|nr:hypothetical protein CSUB01_01449 [Colletotrichum sublineola]